MKKALSFILVMLLLFLGGCGDKKKENQDLIEVNLYSNGEIINTLKINKGDIALLEDIEREGYTFAGWYYEESFDTKYEFAPLDADQNFYAKWIADEYTISLQLNGGKGTRSLKVNHGDTLVEPTEPTRDDYEFIGWYIDSELTQKYDFATVVNHEFTLYAKWEEIILPLVNTEEESAYYIITSFGEDASTMMNINYHTKNINTSLEYTKASDDDFTNKKVVKGTMKAFEAIDGMEQAFERRNVVRVNLTGLTPNTEYKYRINKGNGTYTETYYFKTSGGDSKTSFLFATDIHYYDGFDGAEASEEVVKQALALDPNISFVFQTGDLVDTGGNSADWNKFFTNAESNLQKLVYHNIPGNHEHYIVSPNMGLKLNKVFSSFYNFPLNGEGEYYGTSHYFIHNDTLFIEIDTDLPLNQGDQLIWLENVLKNNPTKFIIVGTHAPVNVVGSTDYNRSFMNIMEKYAVDLVLCGHYHSDDFTTLYRDENPLNDSIGVTYLRGTAGGVKGMSTGDDPLNYAKGYIIDVLDDTIQIRMINGKGEVIKTREVKNSKASQVQSATQEELMASIKGDYNKETGILMFTWSEKFYGNVTNMVIKEEYREKRDIELLIPTPGYTYHKFTDLNEHYDHKYTFIVTFKDGKVLEKEIEFLAEERMNLKLKDKTETSLVVSFDEPNTDIVSYVYEYEIYVDGSFVSKVKANQNGENITEVNIENINAKEVTIKAYARSGYLYEDTIEIK